MIINSYRINEPTEKEKMMAEKFTNRLLSSISAVGNAEQQGFFIESIARIDAILGFTLGTMIIFSYATDDEEKALKILNESIGDKEFTKMLPKILEKKGLITKEHYQRIQKFKTVRNAIVHDIVGDWKLLTKRNEFTLENLESKEKKLLKSECKKGKQLVVDLVKQYLESRFKGRLNVESLKWD